MHAPSNEHIIHARTQVSTSLSRVSKKFSRVKIGNLLSENDNINEVNDWLDEQDISRHNLEYQSNNKYDSGDELHL